MIRVKLTLLTQWTLSHINPSHQDEPFQSIRSYLFHKFFELWPSNILAKFDSRSILFHRIVAYLSLHLSHTPWENLVNYWQNLRGLIFNKSVKQVRPNSIEYQSEVNYAHKIHTLINLPQSCEMRMEKTLASEDFLSNFITFQGQINCNVWIVWLVLNKP